MLLIAIEEKGWVFLNGLLVVRLMTYSHNLDEGWISVVGDFWTEHQG